MLSSADIPEPWCNLLDDLQRKYPKVVLAGGALRDLDHGVEVKDLDIFIGAGDIEEAQALNELMGGVKDIDLDTQAYPANMPELILVTKLEQPVGGIEAQLIFCNWDVEQIWRRFDYGICQIMFNGLEVRVSDDYDSDKSCKHMTLLRADTEYALSRSIERFARWRPKYPEHQWRLGCRVDLGVDREELVF